MAEVQPETRAETLETVFAAEAKTTASSRMVSA